MSMYETGVDVYVSTSVSWKTPRAVKGLSFLVEWYYVLFLQLVEIT